MIDPPKNPYDAVREQLSGIPQGEFHEERPYDSIPMLDPDRERNRVLLIIALLLVVLDINVIAIAIMLAKKLL